jgi:hypothetical protein
MPAPQQAKHRSENSALYPFIKVMKDEVRVDRVKTAPASAPARSASCARPSTSTIVPPGGCRTLAFDLEHRTFWIDTGDLRAGLDLRQRHSQCAAAAANIEDALARSRRNEPHEGRPPGRFAHRHGDDAVIEGS